MPGSGIGKDRPRRQTVHYVSSEATATIPAGVPACFTMSGTRDGGEVELPSSAASGVIGNQLVAGIALQDVKAGETGEFAVNGYLHQIKLTRITRSASTVTYATTPAVGIGGQLLVESVANGVLVGAVASTGAQFNMVALEILASVASAATTTSDSSTSKTAYVKAFLRLM